MEFLPSELIRKKRFGGKHSPEEIRYLVQGYSRDKIPDYQMAAWLMAVCFAGMTADETACFTQEMRDSGVVLDLSSLGVTVDKHSTGGMGDKTSLILAPLVAAAGVPVPMMAGRGLAHTGGTLDKLESISGFNVRLDFEAFKKQIASIGTAIIGQTHEMCPADRKLYALRDVTGTVDSLPLICGSIMSKKLAEGMSALVLDVKYGSGAFMKRLQDAEALAQALMDIGKRSDKRVVSMLTRMDEPLGRYVGNALEVRECLDILEGRQSNGDEGKTYSDTIELTLELAGQMIFLGGKAGSPAEGKRRAIELIANGAALDKFERMCAAQGGDLRKGLPEAAHKELVRAGGDGYFEYTNLEKLGLAGVHLGAGRKFQTDVLDLGAGIEIYCEQGQRVVAGQTLFKMHYNEGSRLQAAMPVLRESFAISAKPAPRSPLIAKVLT
jgi:pyrimidine-nucleoside phosphorylase